MSALAFADPTFESQTAFRRIMRAMSAPGTILACGEALAPPPPLARAAAAALLTLADFETPLWIAPRVAAVLAAHPEIHTLASTGFAEPSLRLLCGTATEFLPGAAAARFLMAGPGRAVLVEGRARSGFEAEANRLGEEPVVVATLDGFNYSSGRHVTLTLFAGP